MAYSINAKDYFNTKLYTGNDSTNAQTGVGFQPDWVWLKNRSTGSNKLMDAVRGSSSSLCTNNSNAAEGADYFASFDSDGFTVATSSSDINADAQNYVGWNWKANGQGSSNTNGTINSTYTSANTTSGFSIVSYTGNGTLGATVGHGLGQTPGLFLTKRLSGTSSWGMYHQSTGAGGFMELNSTNALQSNTAYFNNTAPTSSVFSIGTDSINNTNGSTYIAYCFAEKTGFSKFSSYTGNGNADGPFVYTGFKPAFIILKTSTIASNDWHIFDSKRIGYNTSNYSLKPNSTAAEVTSLNIDLLSNGFKLRGTQNDFNGNGGTYIYMAFAEAPLVGTNNVPATAR